MLRRIPSTPLVCLAIILPLIFLNASWAAGPDESMEILLKPNQPGSTPPPVVPRATSRVSAAKRVASLGPAACLPVPAGITKVKPAAVCYPTYYAGYPDCFLATPRPRQWDLSVGVLFAKVRGNVAWPRYNNYYAGWWGWENGTGFTDQLQLPGHLAIPTWSARYQFRPTWAVRYQGLGFETNGGGQVQDYFTFGPWWQIFSFGQNITTKWAHGYHRAGLVYDAIKNCRTSVSVFADWVHSEDKITAGCPSCGYYSAIFSKSADMAMAGLEWQRCIKTAANGGTLSWDCRAGGMFLDNAEGWDVQAGARYTIPLNSGRWGYVKGGYRLVELKKSQDDFMIKHALEGGYLEAGFIF